MPRAGRRRELAGPVLGATRHAPRARYFEFVLLPGDARQEEARGLIIKIACLSRPAPGGRHGGRRRDADTTAGPESAGVLHYSTPSHEVPGALYG